MSVTIVVWVVLTLICTTAYAIVKTQSALKWRQIHEQWLEPYIGGSETWAPDKTFPSLPSLRQPSPLHQRLQLLQNLSSTSLAEGDLGRLILRRDQVPQQAVIGSAANLLISIALASTIGGLIYTISSYLAPGGHNEIKDAIRDFPLFFIPTLFGVVMGAGANAYQSKLDEDFDLLWDCLDRFTITQMLVHFIKPKSALEQTTERLAEAARLFESSGGKLSGTIGQLENASAKLSQLDPTQWALGLKSASDKFDELIKVGLTQITVAAERYEKSVETYTGFVQEIRLAIERQNTQISKNAEAASKVLLLLEAAGDYKNELSTTLRGFQASVDELKDLRDKIDEFGINVGGFGDHLNNWAEKQNQQTAELVKQVASITDGIQPVLEEWRKASDFFAQNHEDIKKELRELLVGFDTFHGELNTSQAEQILSLKALAKDFSNKNLEYWQQARAELSEKYDSTPELIKILGELVRSFEGTKLLGTSLPKIGENLEKVVGNLGDALDDLQKQQADLQSAAQQVLQTQNQQLVACLNTLAQQNQRHEAALEAISQRLALAIEATGRTSIALPTTKDGFIARLWRKIARKPKA